MAPLATVAYILDIAFDLDGWGEVLEAVMSALTIAFAWFALRRWREFREEAALRRRSETSLTLNHDRLMDLLEASSDRFWETDDQYRIVWRSRAGEPLTDDTGRYLGKTRWEALGIDPKDDRLWAAHIADLDARRPYRNFRFSREIRGRVAHRILNGRPFFDETGKFLGYRGTSTDITKEVEAQIAAAATQAQFLSAIEGIGDGYALWGSNDTLTICNERFAHLYGYKPAPAQPGIRFETFLRTSDLRSETGERTEQWLAQCLRHHRDPSAPLQCRLGDRWVEVRDHHLADGRILTVTHDITAQKELEGQLQSAQKLKAVGQLTGGIAHDFNNLLQVILGNIEMILEQVPNDSKLAAQAGVAKAASERGADLIRRLMAFSRQQPLQPKAFDINHMVAEMSEIARRTLGEDIAIKTHLPPSLPPVYLDRVQAEAAFLNLAINARDAMPEGGTLFIETAEVQLDEQETSEQLELPPGRYVVLSVTDTGTGMSAEVLARVFEPFFTTKDVGKGTGLGLSMTYGFIKQSGGEVKIYSEPGIGTAVKLYLPIAKAADIDETATVTPEAILMGNETILLVEDEEAVRNYALTQLRQLGYRVIAATDGASALQAIKDNEGHIDLLFTDIIMPGSMNGRQLAENVTALYPNLKVLYTSGYNRNAIIHSGKLEQGIALLEKPYHKIDLARKLRELLDGVSRPPV